MPIVSVGTDRTVWLSISSLWTNLHSIVCLIVTGPAYSWPLFWIIPYIAAWTSAYTVFDLHFLSDSDPAYDSVLHSLFVADLGLLCNFITISDSGLCHSLDAYLGPLYYEYSFCLRLWQEGNSSGQVFRGLPPFKKSGLLGLRRGSTPKSVSWKINNVYKNVPEIVFKGDV